MTLDELLDWWATDIQSEPMPDLTTAILDRVS